MRLVPVILCLLAATLPASLLPSAAQDDQATAAAAETQATGNAAKYLEALRRRPTGGYLFDRFFDAWLESGTIDGLAEFLKKQSLAESATTTDRLLYAFFLVKQGREAEALGVFEAVLEADPDNAEAWAETAKARARTLDFERALEALDQALAVEPGEDLAIELGKLKGRWLARSGKTQPALEAWRALAKAHPNDGELREDLVDLQLAESLIEEALATQAALIEATDDPYLKITRRLRLGDIHLRANQSDEARDIYRQSLADAGRDTWLEKEILAQIEQLFRREDDLTGLKAYYAELVEAEPGRVAAMRRQAQVLAQLDEADEAIAVFREILKMTPGDRENREAFVTMLGQLGKSDLAAEQMHALSEAHPDDAEVLAQLAVWQHAAKQPDAARATVLRYLELSEGSEYHHLRAMRLLERFEQPAAAEEVLDRLAAKFPDSAGVREEQAAFLHRRGKTDESAELWRSIAADGTVQDAARAARFLSSRGQREVAYEILKSRAADSATDFGYLGRLCNEAIATDHAEEALPWMEKRIVLAQAPVDFRDALRQAVNLLERAEKTEDYRENLRAEHQQGTLSETRVCLLAELLERNGEFEAAEGILQPLIDGGVALAMHQRTRQLETRGEWQRAAEVFRKVLETEGGQRSNHLQRLAELYRRALNYDEALTWIEEWKKLSPGSPQPWLEQAATVEEKGDTDAAIAILRRAAARFEDEESARTQLATYLQQQGKLADAERIYWNLYEESEDISSKLRWVSSLSSLATQQGKVERLVEAFEERHRDNRTSIAPLLAVAEIHRRNGNYEGRREALLEATRLRPEDLALLQQIASIEEQEGDWERAADTLKSALPLDKTNGTERRIALLYLRYGDEDEGYRRFMDLGGGDAMDADAVLGLADAMIARSGWERAIELLDAHRDRFPDDYRIGYLRAVCAEELGEDETAMDAFLDLLSHETEIAKNPATTGLVGVYSRAGQDYLGPVPEGTHELLRWTTANYYAFYYRQQLRSGRVRFQSGPSSAGGGLVRLPGSLEELRQFAVGHLHGLATLLDEEQLPQLASAMQQRGIRDAEVLLSLPFSQSYSPQIPFPADVLERFPEDLSLAAMAVISFSNWMQNQPVSDPTALLSCYQILNEDFPTLAMLAAEVAASSNTDESLELLRTALDTLPEFDNPPSILIRSTASLLVAYGDENFPAELKADLLQKLQTWREIAMRRQAEKNKQINPLSRFNPGDPYAAVLRKAEDLSEFAAFLEEENAAYERFMQSSGQGSSGGAQSSLGQYMRYVQQRQPLLAPLSFPPAELPGIAPNVLLQFVATPGISFGFDSAPLTAEQAATVVGKVSDPIVAVLFANVAEDDDATGKLVEKLLADASRDRERPPLREALIAAAWYQKSEQWVKAAQVLESVRLVPMSQGLRQRIDASLVVCAREAGIDSEAFEAADAQGLAKWGPAAALRLRYGFMPTEKRSELVAALDDFGFETEARRLEAKASATQGSATTSTTTTVATPPGLDEQIDEMVENGKREQAQKLLTRTLDQSTRALVSSPNLRWDYDLLNLLNNVRRQHADLLEKIYEDADPGDSTKPAEHIRYAALLELDARVEEAAEAYQRGLELMSESARRMHLPRLALLQGMTDPEAAAETLAKIDPRQLASIRSLADSIMQPINYSGNRSELAFDARLNLARSAAIWLNTKRDDASLRKMDLNWVESAIRYPLASNTSGIADLYIGRSSRLFRSSSSNSEKANRRRAAHDELCKAMIGHPQLARVGFGKLACLRIADAPEAAFDDDELTALANQAIDSFSRSLPNTAAPPYGSWRHMNDELDTMWMPEEFLIWSAHRRGADRASVDPLLEKVAKSRDRDVKKAATAFADLVFGAPELFEKSMRDYLDVASGGSTPGGPQGYYAEYANHLTDSTASKAFQAWQLRREDLPADHFDIDSFLIDAVKKARQTWRNESTLLAANYLCWLGENDGWPAATSYLYRLTETWLGDEKRWDRFKKEAEQKVPNGRGGHYYQGGEFTDPVHKQFAGFLTRCASRPESMFPVMAFVDDHELDHNRQISEQSISSQLNSDQVTKNPQIFLSMIQQSPFVEDAPAFRAGVIRDNYDPAFKAIFDGAAKWPDADKATLRKWLEEKATFGARLALAYLDDLASKGGGAFPKMLGEERAAIEAMPANRIADLDILLARIYPKGVPDDDLSDDTIAVLDKIGTERAKSVREEAEEFLQVKNLSAIDIDRSYELERKLGPLLDPLLKAGEWDLMERVYRHSVDLVSREQKKGSWDSYRNTWGFSGAFLYDLLDDTNGGGLERIGFFERLIRRDPGDGSIAISGGGMRFDQHLQQAFQAAGGPESLDAALSKVAAKVWELSGGEGPQSHLGMSWAGLLMKFKPADTVRAIAWADANRDGQPWSPMARDIAMAWRMSMTSSTRKDLKPFAAKVPDLGTWRDHYLAVLADETLSVTWRMALAREVCDGAPGIVTPELAWACSELMAEAILDDHQFNGWAVFYVTQEFCALPRDERWIAQAEKINEGWIYRNRLNQKEHAHGESWYPWDELVLQMLDLHCKLGDTDKLDAFLAESNATEELRDTARAVFCLVEHGFHEQAAGLLHKSTEWQDVGTDYPTGLGDYNARYTIRIHEQLPAFLEQLNEKPGLRCFAEALILGANDPPLDQREKDLPYLLRMGRLNEAAKRFAEVDFQGDDTLRKRTLRQFAIADGACWTLREPLAELYDAKTLKSIPASQNYRRIEYDVRTVAAHAGNRLRIGDLKPLREFLIAIKASTAERYYRREAVEHFSLRIATTVKNRAFAMKPAELQAHADALHLLVTHPDNDTIEHSGLQITEIARNATEIFLELNKEAIDAAKVKTQLQGHAIGDARQKILDRSLYRKSLVFWTHFTQTMKFAVANAAIRPDDGERHRRVDAIFARPAIREAVAKEKNRWSLIQRNQWVTTEEADSDWGKALKALWDEKPAD